MPLHRGDDRANCVRDPATVGHPDLSHLGWMDEPPPPPIAKQPKVKDSDQGLAPPLLAHFARRSGIWLYFHHFHTRAFELVSSQGSVGNDRIGF